MIEQGIKEDSICLHYLCKDYFTSASCLIDSRELSLVEIRDILGHNDSQTTLNYYGFAVGSEKERADSITSALKAVGFEEMVSKSSKMVSKSSKTKSPGTLIK